MASKTSKRSIQSTIYKYVPRGVEGRRVPPPRLEDRGGRGHSVGTVVVIVVAIAPGGGRRRLSLLSLLRMWWLLLLGGGVRRQRDVKGLVEDLYCIWWFGV